jgi:uncharacterized protein
MQSEIPAAMRATIEQRLAAVEGVFGVEMLFAIESGSRAWGFGSPDSDYDVRFIYRHPQPWYVQLTEPRDVIELGIDEQLIDLNGWDVRKALRLSLKSNPALYEWLVSPIVYLDRGSFRADARQLFEQHASIMRVAAHYWSIARTQWKSEIDNRDDPKLKKYFYCIRPLLSLQYVIAHRRLPPMNIAELFAVAELPTDVRAAIDGLLAAKRDTPELGRGGRMAIIDAWILSELERNNPRTLALADAAPDPLNTGADRLFRATIGFTG